MAREPAGQHPESQHRSSGWSRGETTEDTNPRESISIYSPMYSHSLQPCLLASWTENAPIIRGESAKAVQPPGGSHRACMR